jgi:hypothetical protein
VDDVLRWSGFLGAWLLVAGSLYQAATQLREEDNEIARLRTKMHSVPRPEPVSRWWWLLPPVYLVLQRRQTQELRTAVMAQLDAHEFSVLHHFADRAWGWMLVTAGGLLLATEQTWELTHSQGWSDLAVVVLAIAMAALGVLHTLLRVRSSDRQARDLARREDPAPAP